MTFSLNAKKECVRLPLESSCCIASELAAFLRLNGVLELGGLGKLGISMKTESPATARRVFKLVKTISDLKVQVFIRKKMRLNKNYTYLISIYPSLGTKTLLMDLGMMREDFTIIPGIDAQFKASACCRRAYLRGCFLASGAVSEPKKGRYHCEVLIHDDIHGQALMELANEEKVAFKQISRKDDKILYLKNSQQIAVFLAKIGATSAALAYENARVFRGVRNHVNRLVNSETANLNKTLKASWRQVNKIKMIQQSVGLTALPMRLREVAQLRLTYPEYSLNELAQEMSKPISKSAMNYRLRQIEILAEQIKEDYEHK